MSASNPRAAAAAGDPPPGSTAWSRCRSAAGPAAGSPRGSTASAPEGFALATASARPPNPASACTSSATATRILDGGQHGEPVSHSGTEARLAQSPPRYSGKQEEAGVRRKQCCSSKIGCRCAKTIPTLWSTGRALRSAAPTEQRHSYLVTWRNSPSERASAPLLLVLVDRIRGQV